MVSIGEMIALAATGLVVSNRDNNPEIKNKNNKAQKEKRNTIDIYSCNNNKEVRNEYESLGKKRFKESRDFKDTGVIPKDYKGYDDWKKRNKNKQIMSNDFNNYVSFGTDKKNKSNKSNKSNSSSDSILSDVEDFSDFSNYSNYSNLGSDEGYHGISMSDPTSVIDKMSSITNNRKFESCVGKKKNNNRNMG